jgi:hypothetical protein
MSDANHRLSPAGIPRRGRGPIGVRAGIRLGPVGGPLQADLAVANPTGAAAPHGPTARARSRPSRIRPL